MEIKEVKGLKLEKLKKFTPFIIGGLFLGGGALLYSKMSGAAPAASVATLPDQGVGAINDQNNTETNNRMTDLVNATNEGFSQARSNTAGQISDLVGNTNTAFSDQKSYFDNLTTQLKDSLSQSNDTIGTLTSQVHDIQAKVDTPTLIQPSIIPANVNQPTIIPSIVNKDAIVTNTTASSNIPIFSRLLTMGSKGSDVKQLQTELNTKGYGLATDGIYGAKTSAAVTNYQSNNNLVVDNKVGPKTLGSLFASSTPSSNPIPTGNIPIFSSILTTGSKGNDVKQIQTQLNTKGYKLSLDGIYGAKTAAAVKDYQTKNRLTVDNKVGPKTVTALFK